MLRWHYDLNQSARFAMMPQHRHTLAAHSPVKEEHIDFSSRLEVLRTGASFKAAWPVASFYDDIRNGTPRGTTARFAIRLAPADKRQTQGCSQKLTQPRKNCHRTPVLMLTK